MSPYYKAVVDGRNPLPKDWCGVFVTLHERTKSGYKERAYAYNLYRENTSGFTQTGTREGVNYFRDKPLELRLGNSRLNSIYLQNGPRFNSIWSIELSERNLWVGTTKANLTFTSSFSLDNQSPIESEDKNHNWVCVAPDCQVNGSFTFAGKLIPFSGRGYHDHNFGRLPWSNTKQWLWGRLQFPNEHPLTGGVFYALRKELGQNTVDTAGAFLATWNETETFRYTTSARIESAGKSDSSSKLYEIDASEIAPQPITVWQGELLQRGPFYKRFLLQPIPNENDSFSATGIGEIFQPARLCGPIISRMMWTRIRRRS